MRATLAPDCLRGWVNAVGGDWHIAACFIHHDAIELVPAVCVSPSGRAGATGQRGGARLGAPLPISGATDDRGEPLELGRSYDFTLASGVEHFSFYYTWAIAEPHFPQEPPPWAEIIGDGVVEAVLPEGIEVTLVLHDPGSVSGGYESTFKDVVTFRSASSPVPSYLLRLTGN